MMASHSACFVLRLEISLAEVLFGRADELMMAVVKSHGPTKRKNKNKKQKLLLEKDMLSLVTSRHQTDPELGKIARFTCKFKPMSWCHAPYTRLCR